MPQLGSTGTGGAGIREVTTLPTGDAIRVRRFYLRTTDDTLWRGAIDVNGNKILHAINSNFRFGNPPVIVADDSARDTHFTNNPSELTQYNDNPDIFIAVGTGFQHRVSNAWADAAALLIGPPGPKGDEPSDPRLNALISPIVTAMIAAGNYQSAAQVNALIATALQSGNYTTTTQVATLIANALSTGQYQTRTQILALINTAIQGAGFLTQSEIQDLIDTAIAAIPGGGGSGGGISDYSQTVTYNRGNGVFYDDTDQQHGVTKGVFFSLSDNNIGNVPENQRTEFWEPASGNELTEFKIFRGRFADPPPTTPPIGAFIIDGTRGVDGVILPNEAAGWYEDPTRIPIAQRNDPEYVIAIHAISHALQVVESSPFLTGTDPHSLYRFGDPVANVTATLRFTDGFIDTGNTVEIVGNRTLFSTQNAAHRNEIDFVPTHEISGISFTPRLTHGGQYQMTVRNPGSAAALRRNIRTEVLVNGVVRGETERHAVGVTLQPDQTHNYAFTNSSFNTVTIDETLGPNDTITFRYVSDHGGGEDVELLYDPQDTYRVTIESSGIHVGGLLVGASPDNRSDFSYFETDGTEYPVIGHEGKLIGNALTQVHTEGSGRQFKVYTRNAFPQTVTRPVFTRNATNQLTVAAPWGFTDNTDSHLPKWESNCIELGNGTIAVGKPNRITEVQAVESLIDAKVVPILSVSPYDDLSDFQDFILWSASRSATGQAGVRLFRALFWDVNAATSRGTYDVMSNENGVIDRETLIAELNAARRTHDIHTSLIQVRCERKFGQVIGNPNVTGSNNDLVPSGNPGAGVIAESRGYDHLEWADIGPNGLPLVRNLGNPITYVAEIDPASQDEYAVIGMGRVQEAIETNATQRRYSLGDGNLFPAWLITDTTQQFSKSGGDSQSLTDGTISANDPFIVAFLRHGAGLTPTYSLIGGDTYTHTFTGVDQTFEHVGVRLEGASTGDILFTANLSQNAKDHFRNNVIGRNYGDLLASRMFTNATRSDAGVAGLGGIAHSANKEASSSNTPDTDEFHINNANNLRIRITPTGFPVGYFRDIIEGSPVNITGTGVRWIGHVSSTTTDTNHATVVVDWEERDGTIENGTSYLLGFGYSPTPVGARSTFRGNYDESERPYQMGDIVFVNTIIYQSLVDNNTTTPDQSENAAAAWRLISSDADFRGNYSTTHHYLTGSLVLHNGVLFFRTGAAGANDIDDPAIWVALTERGTRDWTVEDAGDIKVNEEVVADNVTYRLITTDNQPGIHPRANPNYENTYAQELRNVAYSVTNGKADIRWVGTPQNPVTFNSAATYLDDQDSYGLRFTRNDDQKDLDLGYTGGLYTETVNYLHADNPDFNIGVRNPTNANINAPNGLNIQIFDGSSWHNVHEHTTGFTVDANSVHTINMRAVQTDRTFDAGEAGAIRYIFGVETQLEPVFISTHRYRFNYNISPLGRSQILRIDGTTLNGAMSIEHGNTIHQIIDNNFQVAEDIVPPSALIADSDTQKQAMRTRLGMEDLPLLYHNGNGLGVHVLNEVPFWQSLNSDEHFGDYRYIHIDFYVNDWDSSKNQGNARQIRTFFSSQIRTERSSGEDVFTFLGASRLSDVGAVWFVYRIHQYTGDNNFQLNTNLPPDTSPPTRPAGVALYNIWGSQT